MYLSEKKFTDILRDFSIENFPPAQDARAMFLYPGSFIRCKISKKGGDLESN